LPNSDDDAVPLGVPKLMTDATSARPLVKERKGFVPGILLPVLLFVLAALFFFYVLLQLPSFGDWNRFYHPVAQNVGEPYSIVGFLNPVWVAWVLYPFSYFSVQVGGALWMALSILLAIGCIHRLQGSPIAILLTLLSPAFLRFITSGQIDILPLLGFTLLLTSERLYSAGWGIIFMTAKPQVFGAALITYWASLDSAKRVKVLLPFLAAFSLSLVAYGFWPADIDWSSLNHSVDFSPWPYGIPVGLGLLAWSIGHKNVLVGGLSTYFLVPYFSPSSLFVYTAVLFAKAPLKFALLLFFSLWAFAILFT
jgi:hypothetical protein